MTKLKALAANRWFWRIVGALVAGLILWFVGPLIAIGSVRPLGWWPVALVVALLPILGVGLFWYLDRRRAAKKNAALVDALAPTPGATEKGELETKLSEALGMLRATKVGRRGAYMYQLPWYAIIGPSGAGKTTALLNSGLAFPTAVAGEYRALRGQPNTPNCDWWFTDEAVLIDTAGRYVTQEAGAADAEGWRGFLDLLKRHRPLQPLNGVIAAIPAPDFADAAKMARHAENLRTRLTELTKGLGQELPVYLLVTKADLLPGFREYFARNTDAQSAQVFGSTAPGDKPDDASVLAGFDALVTRVSALAVGRMEQEPELPRRAEIAAFPAQLASLRKPIAALMASFAQASRFDGPARVRGVYLASGTQTGNPVDRILLSAGLPATAPAHGVGSGRAYFLKRLFSDVIIPEQGLAARNASGEKRQRLAYRGGLAAAAAALVVTIGLWGYGYAKNRRLIAGVYDVAQAYTATGASADGAGTPDVELAALGVLGKARADMADASDFGLGLGQGGRLEGEIRAIYGRDLQRRLMPMLAQLATDRIGADMAAPNALYDDLKSYLILGGRGPLDEGKALVAWVQPAWGQRGGTAEAQAQAGEVAQHAQALVDYAFKPVAVEDGRIEAARAVIRAQPAAVRVYGRLKSEALAESDSLWNAADNAGPQPGVFFAATGAFAPGAGVPKLFTKTGYETVFVPALAGGAKLLDEERWVVGDVAQRTTMTPAELSMLKADLSRLYFDEFLTRWRDYMAAMQPKPATTLQENIQRLRDGSGPLSPIPPLMRAIATATDMTPSVAFKAPAIPGAGMLAAAGVLPAGGDDPRGAAIRAFAPLRLFVGKAGTPGPMDAVVTNMGQLADKLNLVSVLPGGGGATGAQASLDARAAVAQLEQAGATMPAPAGPWVQKVAGDASGALGGARMSQMGAALGENFGPACREALAGAFPFQAASARDVALPEFARFFGPQGAFATFVSQELQGYVDTSGPEWVALPNAGEISLTPAGVSAFQAAGGITRAFFAADPAAPRLSYQIEPVALAGAAAVTLTIDGQTLKYDGKTPLPATFDWPGAGGATLAFTGDGAGEPRNWPGQWAAFRMMKAAAVRSGGAPTSGTGSLTSNGARFDFRIRTFAGANPFVVDPFAKVSCPV
ncbi:MAG: type VI secretion system membrane subunit TssM [Sphingomonas fennica]